MAKKQSSDEPIIDGQVEYPEFEPAPIDLSAKPQDAKSVIERVLPTGQEVKARDLVGQNLVLRAIRPFTGTYGAALYCTFTDDGGAIYSAVIGGQVVAPKLWACRNNLPVSLRFKWVEGGKYEGYLDLE